MNIHEFQAKQLFGQFGIPVPKGKEIKGTVEDREKLLAEKLEKVKPAETVDKDGKKKVPTVRMAAANKNPSTNSGTAWANRNRPRPAPLRAPPRRRRSDKLSVLTCGFLPITGGGPSSI